MTRVNPNVFQTLLNCTGGKVIPDGKWIHKAGRGVLVVTPETFDGQILFEENGNACVVSDETGPIEVPPGDDQRERFIEAQKKAGFKYIYGVDDDGSELPE